MCIKISKQTIHIIVYIVMCFAVLGAMRYAWHALSVRLSTKNAEGVHVFKGKTSQLPAIYVARARGNGYDLYRSDTHEKIIFKGLISESLRSTVPDFILAQKHIDIIHAWNANIITFYINPRAFLRNIDLLNQMDAIIAYAKKYRIYVSLQPVVAYEENWSFADVSDRPYVFLKDAEQFVSLVIDRYKNESHILYSLWTEPHPLAVYDKYFEATQRIIDAAHAKKMNPIMFIDVSMIQPKRLMTSPLVNASQVVYHQNYYSGLNIKSSHGTNISEIDDIMAVHTQMKAPFMLVEFGGFTDSDFNSDEDVQIVTNILDLVNRRAVSYMGYVLDFYHVLALTDKDGNPNKKGDVYKKDLKDYPPTDFSK